MTPDYKRIKLLLKDGPESWSEEKEEIMKQIRSHEGFVSVEVYEKDPVYLIATFDPCTDFSDCLIDDTDDMTETVKSFFENAREVDEKLLERGEATYSITKDPFEIFEESMSIMNELKVVTPDVQDVANRIVEAMTDETKKDGGESPDIRIIGM
jgi:hypothetical protein